MLGVNPEIVAVFPTTLEVKTVVVPSIVNLYDNPAVGPGGAVNVIVHPLGVGLDRVNPVGAAGTVVTEMGADCAESPPVVLVVIAVKEYVVFEVAPVKSAGEVLFGVVGPEGDTVKAVVRTPAPVPPVHPIRNLSALTAGEVCRDKTGVVGGLGAVVYETLTDGVEDEPAEFFAVTVILYAVFAVSPVKIALLP